MRIACLTFTSNGEKIAERIKNNLVHSVDIFKRPELSMGLHEVCAELFNSYEGIIFISSTGIAVRLSAPHIKDKTKDPAVIVVDDLGKFSISLLSGHIGGANSLALEVAKGIDAQPVITTASDGRGIDAVDVFAKRNSLIINNMEDAKKITAIMIEGKDIGLISEVNLELNYKNISNQNAEGFIIVSSNKNIECSKPYCLLTPRNLNLGIGCRKGKTEEEILEAVYSVFHENNLNIRGIKAIGTIELKQDEPGLIEACSRLNCSLKALTNEEVQSVQHMFKQSKFVDSKVGVTAVAEPCAYLLGGEIIVQRVALNGVTVAVSREV